jgi:hypothetical protein
VPEKDVRSSSDAARSMPSPTGTAVSPNIDVASVSRLQMMIICFTALFAAVLF